MLVNWQRSRLVLTLTAVTLFMAGCGDSGPKKYKVHGTVTFAGKPVDKGQVIFNHADADMAPDAGIIEGGKYTMEAKAGTVKVSISGTREVPGKTQSDFKGGTVPLIESFIPEKYNAKTTLEQVIDESNENEINFDLKE